MRSREHHRRDSTGDARLRERYNELIMLRETQPEREAAAAREAMQKNRAASDALVASLRSQLAAAQQGVAPPAGSGDESAELTQLRAENAELRRQLAEAPTAGAAAAATADTTTAAVDARLAFYEMMTGMRFELQGEVAKCTITCAKDADSDDEEENDENEPPPSRGSKASAKTRSAVFDLNLSPTEGDPGVDVEYVPVNLSGCEDGNLPEFLREPIAFPRQQAPGFLRHLIAGIAAD